MVKDSDKIYLKAFGANLKKVRKDKLLSYRQLSHNCNIDYSDISKIEKGEINITLTTTRELAAGLEVHPRDLLDFEIPE